MQEEKQKSLAENKEKRQLEERLVSIIQAVSGKKDVKVKTSLSYLEKMQMTAQGNDPDTAWFRSTQHNPITKKVINEFVYIPPEMYQIPENEAKGKAAHEAGYVAITRYWEFVPDEVQKEIWFSSMLAAVEERPTDNFPRKHYPWAWEWVDIVRKSSFQDWLEAKKSAEKIWYIPKSIALNNAIVYWRFWEVDLLPDDLKEVYSQIETSLEEIENLIPEIESWEKETLELAKERYKKTYLEIWPKVKELVEKDMQNEQSRQMLENKLNQNWEASEENLEELMEMLKEFLNSIDLESLKEILKDSMQNQNEDWGVPIPMDKLWDDLQKKLQEAFDSLPEQERQDLKQKAESQLKELEDEITKELQSEMSETSEKLKTHKDLDQESQEKESKEEIKKRREEQRKQVKDLMDQVDSRLAKETSSSSLYDKAYNDIFPLIEDLYQNLEDIFNPNLKKDVKLKNSWSRINLQAVYRHKSQKAWWAPVVDNKIFEEVNIPDKKEYAITLLVDLSGSMRWEKVQETFKWVVLLTEVLNRLWVKIEVLWFQDEIIEFKDFDTDMNEWIRKKISWMIWEVNWDNPWWHNNYSYNDDWPCLQKASNRLWERKEREKFIFVLSDWLPEWKNSNESDLESAIKTIKQEWSQDLIWLGLWDWTEHVKKFYWKASLPNIDAKHIPEVFWGLLEDIIENPYKYKA